jgi:2-methylcitrate dehydratase PrpD
MGVTKDLVEWITNASYADLPDETISLTKGLLLKTVASMVIGSREPLGKKLIRYVSGVGGTPEVGVVGAGLLTNTENAAFVNGTLAHATETEDAYFFPNNEAVASCWIFPAMLTLGEKLLSTGKEITTATVVALETASRLARSAPGVGVRHGINTAGWFGLPGATAGVSRLLGLNAEQTENAMSIAASQSAGIARQAGFDAHTLEAGHSCRAAVLSGFLAETGASGIPDFVEGGPVLLGPVWEDGTIDLNIITDGLGKPPFDVHKLEFKKYPGCGFVHASVDALATLLKEEKIANDDVERIETEVHSVAGEFCDRLHPTSIGAARFSFQYVLAEVLLRGKVDHTSFISKDRLFEPKFREAQSKVKVTVNPDLALDYKGSRVTVFKKDGQKLVTELKAFWGHPENPLTLEDTRDVLRPFLDSILRKEQRERVEELMLNLEKQTDIRELMHILTFFSQPAS